MAYSKMLMSTFSVYIPLILALSAYTYRQRSYIPDTSSTPGLKLPQARQNLLNKN